MAPTSLENALHVPQPLQSGECKRAIYIKQMMMMMMMMMMMTMTMVICQLSPKIWFSQDRGHFQCFIFTGFLHTVFSSGDFH